MTYHTSDDSGSSGCGPRRGDRAHAFRGRRRSSRSGRGARKERVLHTRISEQLADDIRQFAEDLRVPASNLVRNVLEEVFTVVDGVGDDVTDLFDDLLDEAEGVRDRVFDQARARHRSRRRSRRSARRDERDIDVDAEVEKELRRDEAAEASGGQDALGDPPGADDDAAADPTSEERAAANELFPDVLGWQPLVLNRAFTCGRCQRPLAAGESAFLGLAASGLTEIALCGRCAGRR